MRLSFDRSFSRCQEKILGDVSLKRSLIKRTCSRFDKFTEAATGVVLSEKVFIKISQYSYENICLRDYFLIKLQAEACNFIKK